MCEGSPATKQALVLESVMYSRPAGRHQTEDDRSPGGTISALDTHILRNAFKASIAQLQLPEAKWAEHATAMMRELTGNPDVGTGIIEWIIHK